MEPAGTMVQEFGAFEQTNKLTTFVFYYILQYNLFNFFNVLVQNTQRNYNSQT